MAKFRRSLAEFNCVGGGHQGALSNPTSLPWKSPCANGQCSAGNLRTLPRKPKFHQNRAYRSSPTASSFSGAARKYSIELGYRTVSLHRFRGPFPWTVPLVRA